MKTSSTCGARLFILIDPFFKAIDMEIMMASNKNGFFIDIFQIVFSANAATH